jgi:hypothetical protein
MKRKKVTGRCEFLDPFPRAAEMWTSILCGSGANAQYAPCAPVTIDELCSKRRYIIDDKSNLVFDRTWFVDMPTAMDIIEDAGDANVGCKCVPGNIRRYGPQWIKLWWAVSDQECGCWFATTMWQKRDASPSAPLWTRTSEAELCTWLTEQQFTGRAPPSEEWDRRGTVTVTIGNRRTGPRDSELVYLLRNAVANVRVVVNIAINCVIYQTEHAVQSACVIVSTESVACACVCTGSVDPCLEAIRICSKRIARAIARETVTKGWDEEKK